MCVRRAHVEAVLREAAEGAPDFMDEDDPEEKMIGDVLETVASIFNSLWDCELAFVTRLMTC